MKLEKSSLNITSVSSEARLKVNCVGMAFEAACRGLVLLLPFKKMSIIFYFSALKS